LILFKKKIKFNYITIDIDVPYQEFITDYIKQYTNKFILINMKGYKIKEIKIRKSANENVHIWILFYKKYDLLTLLQIRAFLGDDAYRIRSDLRKIFNNQLNEFMILWDGKIEIKNGKRIDKKAGEWQNFIEIYEKQMRELKK